MRKKSVSIWEVFLFFRALNFFLTKGVNVAVITRGERGVAFASQSRPEMQSVATDKVDPVDSTVNIYPLYANRTI